MAIEAPFCYTESLRRSSSSPLPSYMPSSSSTEVMRPNSPAASAASCTVSPLPCTNTHETIISIDRAGMARSASFRPSRGTLLGGTPIDTATTATLTTALTPAAIPPLLPTRAPGPPTTTANNNSSRRRFSLLSSGFWVSVELFFTLSQILAAIVVLAFSQNERPETPLPVWVVGYAVGCSATLPLLYWRYHHHPPIDNILEQGPPLHHHHIQHHHHHHHQSSPWPPSTSMPLSYPAVSHLDPHDPISSRAYQGITRGASIRVELCMERLRMTLDCFFAVWFVLGNVWVFGRPSSAQESPKLYRLCVAFLALSCVSYAMPFVLCAAVCCCLPCVISLLGFREGAQLEGRGASEDTIAALPVYRFRSKRSNKEKGLFNDSDSDSSSEGGVMGAGTEHEKVIAGDDAACCICLGRYKDNTQLRGLPCSHHFHVECLDQWLKINASCPLCKFSLQGGKNGDGDIDASSSGARRGRRLFEEV